MYIRFRGEPFEIGVHRAHSDYLIPLVLEQPTYRGAVKKKANYSEDNMV